jgi:hypothetical protein
MRATKAILVTGFAVLLGALPLPGHHSFKAQYDEKRPIELNGTVTRVDWHNPHVRFFIDVKDESGKVTNWELELGSPNGLMIQGWRIDSLKPGERVTVDGFPARDGSNLASARKVTLETR